MLTDPVTNPDAREVRALVRKIVTQHCAPTQVRTASVSELGYSSAVWELLAEVGMLGVAVPESAGGSGLGLRELCVELAELGAAVTPEPVLSSSGLALPLLQAAGSASVPGCAAGDLVAALVASRGGGRWAVDDIVAERRAGGAVLHGAAGAVLGAHQAQVLVVLAQDGDEVRAFEVDADARGVTIETVMTIDVTRPLNRLTFEAVEAVALELDRDELERALDAGAIALAAEMVGGAERAMQMTLAYLGTREQFGRLIGTFQALKHRCADAAVRVCLARELVFQAAELLDAGIGSERAALVAAATSRAGEVFRDVAAEAIQLHGGIGFTEEHDIGLYYRRACVDERLLEPAGHARRRLSTLLGV